MTDSRTDERPRQPNDSKSAKPEHEPIVISGEDARQGKIVLNTPARRRWFIGILGLCIVVLVVIGALV